MPAPLRLAHIVGAAADGFQGPYATFFIAFLPAKISRAGAINGFQRNPFGAALAAEFGVNFPFFQSLYGGYTGRYIDRKFLIELTAQAKFLQRIVLCALMKKFTARLPDFFYHLTASYLSEPGHTLYRSNGAKVDDGWRCLGKVEILGGIAVDPAFAVNQGFFFPEGRAAF